ncbi:MAG: hypothetical protein J6J03_09310 [Tyzzerella sp.]|nr:hypothetical protein [Tyzzerella sp.]
MKERAEFLGKLKGLVLKAREQDSQITIDEVKQYFEDATLTEEQMELVFDYLLSQKVVVKGYIKMVESEEEEISYTEEEQEYLRAYEEDLKAFKKEGEGECKKLFPQAVAGNESARNRLTEIYLPKVLEIAKCMYHPGIFLGDLIQEGNLGLVLGLDMLVDAKTAHQTLMEQIRQSIQALIEEYADSSSRDKQMVEQVKFLDESITKLTEELGRKVTIDELSVYMGLTEEEINDILRLTGEEPEENHRHESAEEEK